MQKTTLLAATMIVSAVPCFAQTIVNCGFMFNTSVGATSRGGTPGTSHIEVLVRYDFDDYRAYGIAQPTGGAQIMGLQSIIQDQEGTTPENFNVFIYAQDPANNDFPNYVA